MLDKQYAQRSIHIVSGLFHVYGLALGRPLRLNKVVFKFINSLRDRLLAERKRLRDRKVILESGFFDQDWYVKTFPDVANSFSDPLEHFMRQGAFEQRAAGPNFDTKAYLTANPDVAKDGVNPLLHYVRDGIHEGRGFAPKRSASRKIIGLSTPVSFTVLIAGGPDQAVRATLRSLAAIPNSTFEVILGALGTERSILHNSSNFINSRVEIIQTKDRADFINRGIATAKMEFVIIVDAGDLVSKKAFSALSYVINTTNCDVVYSDETQTVLGQSRPVPALKPSWSPELLTAFNYFGRLTAIRRNVASAALPVAGTGAAAEWDLNLRVSELTDAIERSPMLLCCRTTATACDDRLPKDQGLGEMAVLEAFWRRRGRKVTISRVADGTLRASWNAPRQPLVSIIIPNKDRAHLLRVCTEGIYEKTAYQNIELIIVDNGSTEPETLALYEQLRARSATIIPYEETFNYSRACNLGAAVARGELLLFLNNDIEMIEAGWLDELVRQIEEPGVGIVGPKLLYPDGGIQHAGVALGLFTLAAHVFHRAPQGEWGPIGSPDTTRNWMAVTGACQLVRRSVFDLVGGYDEAFQISYSDIVLCVDAGRAGYRTVYLPSAVLVHHEGASRGHTNPTRDQVLFARRLRDLGLCEDPFFHPSLNMESFVPKLWQGDSAKPNANMMQIDIDRLTGPQDCPIDLCSDGAVASAAGQPWTSVTWRFHPDRMQPDIVFGARILLEFLRRRRDLRRRFPRALTEGVTGGFAIWVKTEGLRLLGLSPDYAAAIDDAFAAALGAPARQILVYDNSLREDQPLFLLPNGREAACRTLFAAMEDGRLRLENIWWFLLANAEAPLAALGETWAITPSWQAAVPDGGTIFGITDLVHWVSATHGIHDDWLFDQDDPVLLGDVAQVRVSYAARPEWRERFPNATTEVKEAQALLDYLTTRASGGNFRQRGWAASRLESGLAREIVQPGVNVLGHFSYPSGLRISTENIIEGLTAHGVAVSRRDVPVSITSDEAIGHNFLGHEAYDTTLIHVQPEPMFDVAYERAGLLPRREGVYRIGYWYWEFDEVPSSWSRAALSCDELWTATEFIAEGLRKRYRQPIRVFSPGIEIPPFVRRPRAAFDLEDDAFVFLFVFHMTSVMDRKNPLGLIRAFKAAFPDKPSAKLVIKTTFGDQHPDALKLLVDAAEGANIVIIDEVYSRDDTHSLIAACDAYVSLHRSEGLGLSMAEAMLLGRPVVATRYSGNIDFMNDANSMLIDCQIVTLDQDIAPYKAGQRWAEPSVVDAAHKMRRLFDDPTFARALGARAKIDLERRLSYAATGKQIADRLAEIAAMP